MKPIKIAYSLIGCFIIIERLLRQGKAAKSFQEGHTDRGSTRAVGATFGLAMLTLPIAPLLNRFKLGNIRSKTLAWSGIVIMLSGLMLRIWASRGARSILHADTTNFSRTAPD